jgi:pyruvate kinase
MSHGEHSAHRQSIAAVRECADRLGIHTAVLADLCGPKIRTGKFVNGSVDLIAGRSAIVTTRDVLGDLATIPSEYPALSSDVRPSDRILLNDGAVELKVEGVLRARRRVHRGHRRAGWRLQRDQPPGCGGVRTVTNAEGSRRRTIRAF